MKLKLTLRRAQGDEVDLLVVVDSTVPVGALADAVARRDPIGQGHGRPSGMTFQVQRGHDWHPLPPGAAMADSGLRPGHVVELAAGGSASGSGIHADVAGVLDALSGPQAGERFPILRGVNSIGRSRDNDICLLDPLVSKRHARITVADGAEVIDLGSANGVFSGDVAVSRALLATGDTILVGDTLLQVTLHDTAGPQAEPPSAFNRPPRVLPTFEGRKVEAPEPPQRLRRQRVPWVAVVAPVLMGMILFALTRQLVTVVFVALSPLMALGNVIETRYFGRREYEAAVDGFREAIDALAQRLERLAAEEITVRLVEHPPVAEVIEAARMRGPLLWARRPDLPGLLEIRLGLGTMPSRTHVELPRHNDADPALWRLLDDVVERFRMVDGVPVVADLTSVGALGIAGEGERALESARAVVQHVIGLHSPAEVVLCALGSAASEAEWDWLKWVPHVTSDHSPIVVEHLAASPGGCQRLVSALEDVIASRAGGDAHGPAVVVLVVDDCPVERSRLVSLAERGPAGRVHVVWLAGTENDLPAACRAFVSVESRGVRGSVGFVREGLRVADVDLDVVGAREAYRVARELSPIVDAGARVDDQSDLPRTVSLLSLLGMDLLKPEAVVDRWVTSGSVLEAGVRRGRSASLRAVVGVASAQEFVLDLREHGPHALVGGTTGSGKSEFLQSWVLAMAAEHSPQRLTFLFVDYKGGSAFGRCTDLPHCVGLVTDLSPHLVRRALTSLRAELHRRERILSRKAVKDLMELERSGDPEAPPSLVVVVDEFAALVAERPEFVDGVVDVAQRGRSLGLHLVLATQRPAGVIRESLRANTNLRIALRVADEADSDDVVGSKEAASFDPAIPGRGIVKAGPGRLVSFQSGYVGGWTSDRPPPPIIDIGELRFGAGPRWYEPEGLGAVRAELSQAGPNDLERIVASISGAQAELDLAPPRRPWLDELAPIYDLRMLPQSRTDARLVFAVQDEPHLQRQSDLAYQPDEGNLTVYGTGGSGKSALLRTLAVSASLGQGRGGPCFVYALDFGARGLQMLEALPNVGAVVSADDDERAIRLLRMLRDEIDARAQRFATVNAGSMQQFRELAGRPGEPRILLFVDNISAFRQAFESGSRMQWLDTFQAIAASGRPVGVHVVVTADRPSAIPSALGSTMPIRVVLRMAESGDYTTLGVPGDALGPESPPGRGFLGQRELQVAVLGGTSDVVRQARVVSDLGGRLEGGPVAPAIGRLPELVHLGQLPVAVGGQPTIGISDETLAAIGVDLSLPYFVVGPPQSGRTSTLATIALSLRRFMPDADLVLLTPRPSPLSGLLPWADAAQDATTVEALAPKLAERVVRGDRMFIVMDDVAEFVSTDADLALQGLLRSCRASSVFVAASSEISQLSAYGPLMQALKAPQHGIALRPDQGDGDLAFKTSLPRVPKAAFPPGRGMAVRAGRFYVVQVAYPEAPG